MNETQAAFTARLKRVYAWYTVGVVGFVLLLGWLEQVGLTRNWIGYLFLLATVVLYAAIGVMRDRKSVV